MAALDYIAGLLGKEPETLIEQHEKRGAYGRLPLEIQPNAEFQRIDGLPRRSLLSGEEWAARLTHALRQPWGKMELRPIQALALAELYTQDGLFAPIRTGAGKTLITFLAPRLAEAKRPVLIVPASLREKTHKEFSDLGQHWKAPVGYRTLGYELLGRPQAGSIDGSGTLLDKYLPDLLVLDECQYVKNRSAAVTKRIRRYLKEHPECKVVALSGTVLDRSIQDFAHIASWCLRGRAPVPQTYDDLLAWSKALDDLKEEDERIRPGALKAWTGGSERLEDVRRAYGQRLTSSPGVVATQDGPLEIPLSIQVYEPPVWDSRIDDAMEQMRATWSTPDGWEFADAKELARHLSELAAGFYYIWDPRPPQEWRDARSTWAKVCRMILKDNRRGLDSQKQVQDAIDAGQYPHATAFLQRWREIEPTFTPNTVPVWVSDEAINAARAWGERNEGLIWVKYRAFGHRLAQLTGWPYYAQEAKTEDGRHVSAHAAGPAICSVASCSTGQNLQRWNRNLVMDLPRRGKTWEQMLARTHRDGQLSAVRCEVYHSCVQHALAFETALRDSRNQQDTLGQAQKLMYASRDYPTSVESILRDGARWSR
jgi:hypothetical protein